MKELFIDYIINIYQDVPIVVYKGLILVFCLVALLMVVFFGYKRGFLYSSRLLFVEYVLLLSCSTVLFRLYNENQGHNFHPLWSYTMIKAGGKDLLAENILNIVAFIPIGLLLGIAFKLTKWYKVLIIGSSISVIVETLQFLLKKGFSEVDDVIHNTLGCLIGYEIYLIVRMGYERISKKYVAVLLLLGARIKS